MKLARISTLETEELACHITGLVYEEIDANEEIIRNRVNEYNNKTLPLKKYYSDEQAFFLRNPKKILKLMKIGEYKQDKAAVTESTAALMLTIQLIYNMEEAIMRG